MFESLTLENLPERSCSTLREPASTRPNIWVVEEGGKRAVVKDFSRLKFLYRNIIGRLLVWREKKAYIRLEGLKGIPKFYRVIDGLAIVVEEIQGENLRTLEIEVDKIEEYKGNQEICDERKKIFSEVFFEALNELVRSYHKRHIVHCDLKRTPNILRGEDGQPYIVDWAAAISKNKVRLFPIDLIYKQFLKNDFLAITKLKLYNRPDVVGIEELSSYKNRSTFEKFIRKARDLLRKIVRKIA